ncbi:MAG: hypothetical protein QOE70_4432 [Chthoniobacter sp.]|jgi:catechol 2,3-dioxygenase-like lactoylglutathione lyase family enzyme|nr:hypothetical protein [Chthoniobacter sp.]
MERSRRFYCDLFKLEMLDGNERFCALGVAGSHVLLLFKAGESRVPVQLPGGLIPPHEASGQAHLGFAISRGELGEWQAILARHGVAIESTVVWPRGGTSLYFRDPDQHLLELLTPGVWALY